MYPYDANRADELTIQPGDVISVLYVDNENWWMGELADGRQGYFPSNYVMEQGQTFVLRFSRITGLPSSVCVVYCASVMAVLVYKFHGL